MLSDIKLVIWDLDETFWAGTLSEGPINPLAHNVERLKSLCDRGVVNSICSKNDFDVVRAKLKELGVWDYFVFPSIMWAPKGQQVSQIIERMNLRPVNVVVVDDNALNREEIKFHNEGIHVLDPVVWVDVDCSDWGKDDPDHGRLKNYKLLEAKLDAVTAFVGDNNEFLRNSNIRCRVSQLDIARHDVDRVVEVLNRTNQLNFTKRRFKSGVAQLLHDLRGSLATGYIVHVEDNYGDYGLCGFMSVSGENVVQDFAFSCRLLDMGVEKALLGFLGRKFPELQAPFEDQIQDCEVDWVQIDEVGTEASSDSQSRSKATPSIPRMLMPTACFSEAIAPLMQKDVKVIGLPDAPPLAARMIRAERRSSVIYWSGKHPEMQALFVGEYDILNIFASMEVTFPTVWLPVIGYFPLPLITNSSVLRQHPDLLASVKGAIANREDFFGRRLEESKIRREIDFCMKISRLPFVSRQTNFSSERYLKDLEDLRARLPEKTLLAITAFTDDPTRTYFNGAWAKLNDHVISRAHAATEVARTFAHGRTDTVILEPVEIVDRSQNDIAGHFSHRQNVHYALTLTSQLEEIFDELNATA